MTFDASSLSALVTEKLKELWCDDVLRCIVRTGGVAVINSDRDRPHIFAAGAYGCAADGRVDEPPYASGVEDIMHAFGQDGHTAILLEAARRFRESRNFSAPSCSFSS